MWSGESVPEGGGRGGAAAKKARSPQVRRWVLMIFRAVVPADLKEREGPDCFGLCR